MKISPTAFIPFCSFGGNLSLVGTKLTKFDIPVCNIFTTKMHYDQLCYEADLEKFKDNEDVLSQMKMGLELILDFNEDRWLDINEEKRLQSLHEKKTFSTKSHNDLTKALIFLDTLSIDDPCSNGFIL